MVSLPSQLDSPDTARDRVISEDDTGGTKRTRNRIESQRTLALNSPPTLTLTCLSLLGFLFRPSPLVASAIYENESPRVQISKSSSNESRSLLELDEKSRKRSNQTHSHVSLRLPLSSPLRILVEHDSSSSSPPHTLRTRELILVSSSSHILLHGLSSGGSSLVVRIVVDEHSSGVGVRLELGGFLTGLTTTRSGVGVELCEKGTREVESVRGRSRTRRETKTLLKRRLTSNSTSKGSIEKIHRFVSILSDEGSRTSVLSLALGSLVISSLGTHVVVGIVDLGLGSVESILEGVSSGGSRFGGSLYIDQK